MKNSKKFHILYVIIIFAILASMLLGCFYVISTRYPLVVDVIKAALGGGETPDPGFTPTTPDGGGGEDYTIDNLNELKAFAKNVREGKDYSGITLKLGNSIDCNGESIGIGGNDPDQGTVGSIGSLYGSFQGTFDGQGFRIYNFKPEHRARGYIESNTYAYGLFPYLMFGTIKNLRVQSITKTISGGDHMTVGGLVGYTAGGKIENCMVENFYVQAGGNKNRVYVGGIFAVGYATVKNCHVKDVWVEGGCGTLAGIGCVYNSNDTWLDDPSNVSYCVVENVSAPSGTKYDYLCYSVGGTNYNHTLSNCYKSKDTTYANLNPSSVGGPNSSYPWYFHSDYNDGWPMLRIFVWWQTLEFKCINGTVSPKSIKIPGDATVSYNATSATITIMGQTITATPNSSMGSAYVTKWSASGTTHTCEFSRPVYMISFLVVSNTILRMNNTITNTDLSFSITSGSNIKYSYELFSNRAGIYKKITFFFVDANGVSRTIEYSLINDLYYISRTTASGSSGSISLSSQNVVSSNISITVRANRKTYDSIFQ